MSGNWSGTNLQVQGVRGYDSRQGSTGQGSEVLTSSNTRGGVPFVNTVVSEGEFHWEAIEDANSLRWWMARKGLLAEGERVDVDRVRELREVLRALLAANNGREVPAAAVATLNAAAVYSAMEEGTWGRLKACRNGACGWAFYYRSRNRSGAWCSMEVCASRTKTRAYRRRRRGRGT